MRIISVAEGIARVGNAVISYLAGGLTCVLLLYGGYCLWDMTCVYASANTGSELISYKPEGSTDGTNPTLSGLQEINPDVIGWLTVDGTRIDYPLVQGQDNQEYVNKDIYGDFSLTGAVFLDSTCSADFNDLYSLLYGHHVTGGGMFSDVLNYLDAEYLQEHARGALYLPDETLEIAFFACIEADAYDRKLYQPTDYSKEEGNARLVSYIFSLAAQEETVAQEEENTMDSIIGLSTCADSGTNERVVLYGRIIRPDGY